MILVDTTVWIDYLRGTVNPHTVWLDQGLDQQRIGLADLSLCEVLQGVREDRAFVEVRRTLERFALIETGGEIVAVAAAQNHRLLRSQGFTVRKTIDCLIATACLLGGHVLLHRDRDFDSFEQHLGLRVVHP